MQYYFSLALSFVPTVGDKSLTETTFTFEDLGYYLQFVIISSSCNEIFFQLNLH